MSLNEVLWFFRFAVFIIPIAVGVFTYYLCREMSGVPGIGRRKRAVVITRSAPGEYESVPTAPRPGDGGVELAPTPVPARIELETAPAMGTGASGSKPAPPACAACRAAEPSSGAAVLLLGAGGAVMAPGRTIRPRGGGRGGGGPAGRAHVPVPRGHPSRRRVGRVAHRGRCRAVRSGLGDRLTVVVAEDPAEPGRLLACGAGTIVERLPNPSHADAPRRLHPVDVHRGRGRGARASVAPCSMPCWRGSKSAASTTWSCTPLPTAPPCTASEGFWEGSTGLAMRRRPWDPAPDARGVVSTDAGAPAGGYSGTPLARKLGIKARRRRGAHVGAPRGWTVPDLPDGARLRRGLRSGADVVLAFVRRAAELDDVVRAVTAVLGPEDALWVLWPRRGRGPRQRRHGQPAARRGAAHGARGREGGGSGRGLVGPALRLAPRWARRGGGAHAGLSRASPRLRAVPWPRRRAN